MNKEHQQTINHTSQLQTIFWFFGAIGAIYIILPTLSKSFEFRLIPDDAYYYFQVARNIVEIGIPSFDGITLASGYHPLWMIICVLLYKIFPTYLVESVVVVSLLLYFIYSITWLAIIRNLNLDLNKSLIVAALVLINPVIILNGWCSGLELPLALTIISLLFWILTKKDLDEKKSEML
jgi:hypothetical protein